MIVKMKGGLAKRRTMKTQEYKQKMLENLFIFCVQETNNTIQNI